MEALREKMLFLPRYDNHEIIIKAKTDLYMDEKLFELLCIKWFC